MCVCVYVRRIDEEWFQFNFNSTNKFVYEKSSQSQYKELIGKWEGEWGEKGSKVYLNFN